MNSDRCDHPRKNSCLIEPKRGARKRKKKTRGKRVTVTNVVSVSRAEGTDYGTATKQGKRGPGDSRGSSPGRHYEIWGLGSNLEALRHNDSLIRASARSPSTPSGFFQDRFDSGLLSAWWCLSRLDWCQSVTDRCKWHRELKSMGKAKPR